MVVVIIGLTTQLMEDVIRNPQIQDGSHMMEQYQVQNFAQVNCLFISLFSLQTFHCNEISLQTCFSLQ